ncbi:hypothetical protein HispidOSU_023964 [Sigmodon hispidus]
MDFWPNLTQKGQEVIQDFIPVLLEVVPEDGHLLLCLLLHLTATTAMGPQCCSYLGLELLLPLHPVVFSLRLGFFFGLLHPLILLLVGLGHLLSCLLLGLQKLLDDLQLTSHHCGNSRPKAK